GRMINIHPSLLPAFPGVDAQQQAIDYGVKLAGCTAHYVEEGVDTGPIIAQAAIPVKDVDTRDTFAARLLDIEHKVLVDAVRKHASGRLKIMGRRVIEL